MNNNLFNIILKNFLINILSFIIFFIITNNKKVTMKRSVSIIGCSIVLTIIQVILRNYVDVVLLNIIVYFLQILAINVIVKNGEYLIIPSILASNAIEYVMFTFSSMLEFIPKTMLKITYSSNIDFILISCINIIMVIIFPKIKRLSKGFSFLKGNQNSEYIDIIMINISAIILFVYTLFKNSNGERLKNILIPFIMLGIIMLTMIQKMLTIYYKQRLLNKTIEDYKTEIADKEEQIKQLSEEKFKISKLNHEFYNRQKALEKKVKEMVNNANFYMETASELSVTKQIESLTKEYSGKLQEIKNVEKLPSTDIEEIDDMFKYMQSECKENNIDFKLQINGNIHHLVNTIIPQNRLVTLIGDHIRDAIIAVNSSDNNYKSIIAILGIKDNTYEFCVYDTGIEFEIDTLPKLGIEPATTHKETGGTGIGFMTTFETLKAANASLIIEEKHGMSEDDYTKAVIIRFDGKHEYKVRSYRAEKIDKNDRMIIEQI